MKHDTISIVEAAYDLESGARAWLLELLERAARLDRGHGLAATIYRLGDGPDESTVVARAMDDRLLNALLLASRGDADSHRIVASGLPFGTTSQRLERLGFTAEEARSHHNMVNLFHPLGVRDILAVTLAEPTGFGVVITAPMSDARRPTRREVHVWTRVAAHVAAGARLRGNTAGPAEGKVAAEAAVLSPSGQVKHAVRGAQDPRARDALRAAVRAVDRARTRERTDEDRSLDLWQGLVAGRWSLVDRFDTDGRRFIVARENDPDVRDPRALTRRERQVLAYAAMGHSLKLVAYSLGLSVSTIALHRAAAMRKLGLKSQAEVMRFFAPKSR